MEPAYIIRMLFLVIPSGTTNCLNKKVGMKDGELTPLFTPCNKPSDN